MGPAESGQTASPTLDSPLSSTFSAMRISENTTKRTTGYELIDTREGIQRFLQAIIGLPTTPPSLYIDLEGANLSRQGTVSIFQVYAAPLRKAYLLDIHKLQHAAFLTPASGTHGSTFHSMLEDPLIPKVIFDVRSDSDALFAHYEVRLSGVQDLQLMELGSRNRNRRYIMGLAKCITKDLDLSPEAAAKFAANKDKGRQLFAPELGGSYEVFNTRPLAPEIIEYCVEDVHYLPKLWALYNARLSDEWRDRVRVATEERVTTTQSELYAGKGPHMMLAPAGWEVIDSLRLSRAPRTPVQTASKVGTINQAAQPAISTGPDGKSPPSNFGSLFRKS